MFARHLKFGAICGSSIFSLRLISAPNFVRAKSADQRNISVYELTNLKIEADCLFEGNEFKKLNQKLENFADCQEVEIQWRRARVAYKMASEETADKEARIFYLKRAMEIAEKALELGKDYKL